MRKFLAIVVCKLGRFVGKLIGKGSSMPGKFALKICPDILKRVTLPPHIIAVTGSNGKTSTVEMIATVLRAQGRNVIYNAEGSNQVEGVTTLILTHATLGGRVKADVLLVEATSAMPFTASSIFIPQSLSSPTSTGTSSPGTATRRACLTPFFPPSTLIRN